VETQLRRLLEAGIALTSELSLDAVLQKLVETAATLTGARYAALGVIDPAGQMLERFLTHGVDPEAHAAIGEPPRGRGILGVLIREATPLRLHDLTEDPRSVGFPPQHPPMKSFLGVPILLRGVAYGNLYLTEKEGGEDFTEEDEEVVTLLAAQAAVAIENARLYESATRWLRQLESLNEIGNALVSEIELPKLLALIARRLRELIGARVVSIALPTPEGDLKIEAADGEIAPELAGARLARTGSKHGRVLERRRTERVDSVIDDPEIDQEVARRASLVTGLYVPLLARDRALGVIALHDKAGPDPRFTDEDVRRLALELRPKALDDFGLVPAIERLAGAFSEQTGIRVDFETALPDERLPSEVETALYRIVQEALTNVAKHAQARHVSVTLSRKDTSVTAVIEDDGRGFEAAGTDGAGLGLVGMRERLGLLDGRLAIESTVGSGTTIVAEVPFR